MQAVCVALSVIFSPTTMKKLLFLAAAIMILMPAAWAAPKVHWSARNGYTYADGAPAYVQTFTVTGLPDSTKALAFNMFARKMQPLDGADTIVELVPGYYRIDSERLATAAPGDTVSVEILTRGRLTAVCYSPDGVHGVSRGGKPFDVEFSRFDLFTDSMAFDAAPSAQDIFRRNEELKNAAAPGALAIVPSFKNIQYTGDSCTVDMGAIAFSAPTDLRGTENYRLTIADNGMALEADSSLWARLGLRLRLWLGDGSAVKLPAARIADGPSFGYRGLMVDVARNFQPASEIHRVLDLMAALNLNVFHFHLVDDEAWRLEIASLPELTAVGSRRGYDESASEAYLPQIFAGNGDADNPRGTANGYYTLREMVDILRHAAALGITVLPEIESPGHARAAIVAMRRRPEYRLDEPADTSVYTSAQNFHDNVMNPALPGPYRFMETVVDEIIDIYREAGVPLVAVHIGGDEVPRNAWGGSPAVRALKDSLGLADDKAVHAYFVERVSEMIAFKGVKVSGWQEVALRHPESYNAAVAPRMFSVNCWSTLHSQSGGGVVEGVSAAGFPALLSNVDHFYLDMCYSPNPYERGLSWGGYVDEFDALHGYPTALAPGVTPIGIQGQVFAETIRCPEGLETMLLPKLAGLAERAWNADSTYSDAEFNAVVVRQLPKLDNAGFAYHVRQPGIAREGDVLIFNSSYPDAKIFVSFDGTMPDTSGTFLRDGDRLDLRTFSSNPSEVRAVQQVGSMVSVPTVLRLR